MTYIRDTVDSCALVLTIVEFLDGRLEINESLILDVTIAY
jgi:hypothetical protein